MSHIPVLDVSPLGGTDADQIAELAAAFFKAYSETGFAYITGHGISDDLLADVFAASAAFHALPAADKLKIALDQNHRGFIAIDTSTDVNSTLAEVTRPNQSESFMMMREDAPDAASVLNGDFLAGPNQWPELPGFRETLSTYHDAMCDLGRRMMGLAAQAIGADPKDILPAFDMPTTWLRLLYYPSTDPIQGDDLYGSAPHTDFGCLTFLAQDDVGGLQVQSHDGTWINAPRIKGAFVVNVGDMLHRWSNGRLKSTPHRVINRSGRARYSVPFFFDPNVGATIAPLASCTGPDRPAQYGSANFGEFLREELGASYDQHQTP